MSSGERFAIPLCSLGPQRPLLDVGSLDRVVAEAAEFYFLYARGETIVGSPAWRTAQPKSRSSALSRKSAEPPLHPLGNVPPS